MVRLATLEDVPRMVELGELFYTAAEMQAIPYNPKSTEFLFIEMIKSALCVVLVLEKDGQIIGGIGGTISPATYNFDVMVMLENFWFIHPDFRGGKGSIELFYQLETAAKNKGAFQLIMGAFNHLKINPLDRIYTKRGYRQTETLYVKEL